MKHILALDQGTTSSRTIVFDQSGNVVSSAQREFRQIFPKPGWVEHDATEIWATQLHTASEAIGKARLTASDIAAIGITNQRETTVVWDRETGAPVHHAIVWQNRRTAAACDRLKARGLAPLIKRKTGLVVDAYFSGTKLAWLLKNVRKTGRLAFGTIDSWLVWNLTGGRVHVTDPSNASRTMLYNLRSGEWDDELLDVFSVPRSVLPAVGSSSEVYGETTLFGGGRALPIAGIAGDQQAALFARAALEGIAFQVADVLRAMKGDSGIRLKELRVDGGASANNLLMQFQSSLLGVPVVRPKVTETTALGAAYLAGLAVGYWKDQKQIAAQWQVDRRFAPAMQAVQRKRLEVGWRKALERAKRWEATE